MKALIESLISNAHPEEAEAQLHSERDPADDFGWFSVRVGAEGAVGASDFQVVVSTHSAMTRARFAGGARFKGLVLQTYSPAAARQIIRSKVESVEGRDYDEIVGKLRAFMFWEYDDYRP